MIVALDTQLAVGTATGAGVYARDLARALRSLDDCDVRDMRVPALDPWRFDRRVLWDQLLLPALAARARADVLHATSGTMPAVRTMPTVVTVHDVAWFRVQGHARWYARAYFGALMRRVYRGASAVVVDSAFTADEYRTFIDPAAVVNVVAPGVDARFDHLVRAPQQDPFVLVTGTVERRKFIERAIRTVAAIPSLRLVSTGPPTAYLAEMRALVAELGISDRVAFRGYVTQPELDQLYATATLALVPSRYEGFGYALAEALCAGVPVIAARTSSLIEVAASDALLLDPDDGDAWIDAVRAVLRDRDAAEARAAAIRIAARDRFAWRHAAVAMCAIYERVRSVHG